MSTVYRLIASIEALIINPIIGLLFALGLVFFLWGLAQFIMNVLEKEFFSKNKMIGALSEKIVQNARTNPNKDLILQDMKSYLEN